MRLAFEDLVQLYHVLMSDFLQNKNFLVHLLPSSIASINVGTIDQLNRHSLGCKLMNSKAYLSIRSATDDFTKVIKLCCCLGRRFLLFKVQPDIAYKLLTTKSTPNINTSRFESGLRRGWRFTHLTRMLSLYIW
jgi:hypothetical protein